ALACGAWSNRSCPTSRWSRSANSRRRPRSRVPPSGSLPVLRVFVGTRLPSVLAEARRELGEQACIVDVSCSGGRVEVIASEIPVIMHPFQAPHHAGGPERIMERQPDAEFFGATLRTPEPELAAAPVPPRPAPARNVIRPPVIALVGPT